MTRRHFGLNPAAAAVEIEVRRGDPRERTWRRHRRQHWCFMTAMFLSLVVGVVIVAAKVLP